MIIESAFLKLPELLTSSFSHADTFEATVVHFLSLALNMELNSRNIPRPFEHVIVEKPYPTPGDLTRRPQADLYLKLEGVVPTDSRMALYGARPKNWIEVKVDLSSTRKSSAFNTKSIGLIFRDILRLCLLPEEEQGQSSQNGRYLIMVFSNEPQKSLAFGSRNGSREWIELMLSDGKHEVTIDLSSEEEKLRKGIGPGFADITDLRVELRLRTLSFIPDSPTPGPVFWGYLMRIIGCSITSPNASINYEDLPNDNWTAERIQKLQNVQKYFLENMSPTSDRGHNISLQADRGAAGSLVRKVLSGS